jgi:hypothetical protein
MRQERIVGSTHKCPRVWCAVPNWTCQVIRSRGEDVPNTATWVRHVALVSRNDVDVEMLNRLASRGPHVDADVKAVWSVLLIDDVANLVYRLDNSLTLLVRSLKPRGNVSTWDDERVSRRDGISIPQHAYEREGQEA